MVSHDQPSIEQSLEFLRRSEPWSALSEEAMRSIALSMRLVVFEPEQTVIHQGAPGRDFHIILSDGRLRGTLFDLVGAGTATHARFVRREMRRARLLQGHRVKRRLPCV